MTGKVYNWFFKLGSPSSASEPTLIFCSVMSDACREKRVSHRRGGMRDSGCFALPATKTPRSDYKQFEYDAVELPPTILHCLDCEMGRLEQTNETAKQFVDIPHEFHTSLIAAAVTSQIDICDQ